MLFARLASIPTRTSSLHAVCLLTLCTYVIPLRVELHLLRAQGGLSDTCGVLQFDDGLPTPLEIGGDAACERALEAAMEEVEPGSYAAYLTYLASARANLASGLPIFIREQFGLDSLATLPSFLRSALLGGGADGGTLSPLRDWPLRTHGGQLADFFDAPRHRELGGFQVAPPVASS